MSTNSIRALAALSLLAIAAPAFAAEDHGAMSATPVTTAAAPTQSAQSAPQAQPRARSAATSAPQGTQSGLMFEKPYRKWWTEDN
jgi:hypothetical protein